MCCTVGGVITQAGVDCSRQDSDEVNVGWVASGKMAGVPFLLQSHEGPFGGGVGQVVGGCKLGLN